MELQDFIRDTLLELLRGVDEAQKILKNESPKGFINPVWKTTDKLYEHMQEVSFDIAVTVSDKKTGSAGGGIRVIAADLSGKGSLAIENSTVSRIAFKVPIVPVWTVVTDVLKP
jgi:hypothetical protein